MLGGDVPLLETGLGGQTGKVIVGILVLTVVIIRGQTNTGQPHLVPPVGGEETQLVFGDGGSSPALGQEAETGGGLHSLVELTSSLS